MTPSADATDQPQLRLFDANCMLGTPAVVPPGGLRHGDDVLAELARCGIERVLAYHALARDWDPQLGNEALEPLLAGHGTVTGCFVPDPAAVADARSAQAVVANLLARRFAAVRLRPDPSAHRYCITGRSVDLLLGACADRRVPALIETSAPDWTGLTTVLRRHPSVPIVLTGIAYRHGRDLYPLLDAHPSLHVETSTFVAFGALEDVAERFGADRLVFGTNLPTFAAGAAIARVVRAELPPDARRAIAGATLDRLLAGVQP